MNVHPVWRSVVVSQTKGMSSKERKFAIVLTVASFDTSCVPSQRPEGRNPTPKSYLMTFTGC